MRISAYVRMAQVCAIVASVFKLPFFFAPTGALAQSTTTGAVMGPVRIPSHSAVPSATVTFQNVELRATRTALTDANSTFRFQSFKPGNNSLDKVTPGSYAAVRSPAGMVAGANDILSSMNSLYQGGMVR